MVLNLDKEKASQYYKMAADKVNDNAMFNYVFMLEKSDGIHVPSERILIVLIQKVDFLF